MASVILPLTSSDEPLWKGYSSSMSKNSPETYGPEFLIKINYIYLIN